MKEQNYKREAVVCIIVAILGWFFLSIVLEPLALWRGIHVMRHTENETTKTLATIASILSGIIIGVMAFAMFIAILSS